MSWKALPAAGRRPRDWRGGHGLCWRRPRGWRTRRSWSGWAPTPTRSASGVGKWRRRFAERRLDGLYDEPRSGAQRKIGDEQIVEIFGRTLEETPPDGTHWSLRSMARAVGYAPSTIHRMWQAFGLQPHRSETFKLSSDPQPVCVRSTVRLQGPFEDGATIDVFEGPGRAVLGPLWGRGNLRGITGIQ